MAIYFENETRVFINSSSVVYWSAEIQVSPIVLQNQWYHMWGTSVIIKALSSKFKLQYQPNSVVATSNSEMVENLGLFDYSFKASLEEETVQLQI